MDRAVKRERDPWDYVRNAYAVFVFGMMILTPIAGFAYLLWDTHAGP